MYVSIQFVCIIINTVDKYDFYQNKIHNFFDISHKVNIYA